LEEDPEGLPDFTLPVAIVAELIPSLAVDITAQSIGNLKVDIASQSLAQLNVAIVASTATIDVNIVSSTAAINVNITAQSVVLNINIADYKPTITPTTMIEKGTQVVATAGGSGVTEIVYECPPNKTAYLLTVSYFALCEAAYSYGWFIVFAYIDGEIHPLVHGILDVDDRMWDIVTGGIIKLKPGDQLGFSTSYDTYTHVTFIVIEV
jgi:hypothetical protein